MSLTNQAKEQIIDSLMDTIYGISSAEYQKRVWIKAEGPEVDDFDETCCQFFDTVDFILERFNDFGLTDNQYQILKNFRDRFEAFSDENSWPPFFIDTPEWAEIMQEAKGVLKAFHYEKSDE